MCNSKPKIVEFTQVILTILSILKEYKKTIVYIEKSLNIKDSKALLQNFRFINKFRRGFNEDDISFLTDVYLREKFPFKCIPTCETNIKVRILINKKQNIYEKICINTNSKLEKLLKEMPEFYLFNSLIVLSYLIDKKQYQSCFEILQFLKEFLIHNSTHTIHYLKSRVYFYLSFVAEKMEKIDEVIAELNFAYRTACLELDEITQNTLINCIVRYFLENNSYEQARNFLSKTKFNVNILTNEDARYLYYLGMLL